ncbi:hypothetical protein LZ575_16005 [Antarcticibacterium sp. 1MA-6-2]|uniref:hypothetical protein n=1 Tax=Antarcticibacterium sp. 1MA-6-2 TaxID=2908210 RepID=UPI001F3A6C21|nr:hypothetical protein [Antarcticibacterium sp. 1MA-6-2]UJH90339.1 hypothetical protein LZ575_16005 [Antarcticibacterium sp. 1MA-6-2]
MKSYTTFHQAAILKGQVMKKTITILGDTTNIFPDLMEVLMKQDLRLLFVSEDEFQKSKLKSRLEQTKTVAEVEFTSCERDGCWEADIIVISQPEKVSSDFLEGIREVATQKIVLATYQNTKKLENSNLKQVLPHSKVVLLQVDSQEKEFLMFGDYPEAGDRVKEIFSGAGYEIRQ